MDTTSTSDNMDICAYVKIKKILYKDLSETKYVRGVVCRKNVSNKRMKTDFESPKIMLIGSSIEYFNKIEETYNNFD